MISTKQANAAAELLLEVKTKQLLLRKEQKDKLRKSYRTKPLSWVFMGNGGRHTDWPVGLPLDDGPHFTGAHYWSGVWRWTRGTHRPLCRLQDFEALETLILDNCGRDDSNRGSAFRPHPSRAVAFLAALTGISVPLRLRPQNWLFALFINDFLACVMIGAGRGMPDRQVLIVALKSLFFSYVVGFFLLVIAVRYFGSLIGATKVYRVGMLRYYVLLGALSVIMGGFLAYREPVDISAKDSSDLLNTNTEKQLSVIQAKATCAKALLPNAAIWAAADRHRALRWQKQLAASKPEDKLNDVAKSVTTVVPAYTLLLQRI